MKKLSLLLALMLILTCGVFAACSDDADTSSTASTPAASNTSSEADDTSSEAATSSDASVDASSDASSEDTSEPAVIAPEGEVISVGAAYTTSQLYRQGGQDVEWGWDPDASIAYPDEDGKSLTDGLFPTDISYGDVAYAGFHCKAPDYEENGYSWIKLDLGEVKSISGVQIYVCTNKDANNSAAGVAAPATVQFLISEDGENWTDLGTVNPTNATEAECVAVPAAANAQFVEVRMTSSAWMIVSEVEVLAPAADTSDVVSE